LVFLKLNPVYGFKHNKPEIFNIEWTNNRFDLNISIIIFCHNEKDNIEAVIRSAKQMAGLFFSGYEIIVVDDGSTDGTADKIKSLRGIHYIVHPVNAGIGMALRSGYKAASNEYVCAIPGDGQFDVNELKQIQPFRNTSFYSFYRSKTYYNIYRRLLTLSNRFYNKLFLGIQLKDVNWIKVYRKDQLDFVDFRMKSSIVESEICAKLIKAGCKPVEIASFYHKRESGEAKGGRWKTLSKAILEMFSLYLIVKNFKKRL
jgi:glycosyltransferase involved in cell wall biosynthesis